MLVRIEGLECCCFGCGMSLTCFLRADCTFVDRSSSLPPLFAAVVRPCNNPPCKPLLTTAVDADVVLSCAAEKAEAERHAAEEARLAAEATRLERERAEAERLEREKAEAELLAAQQAEAEQLAAERAAEEARHAAQAAEAQRLAAERAEQAQREAEERAAYEQSERKAAAAAAGPDAAGAAWVPYAVSMHALSRVAICSSSQAPEVLGPVFLKGGGVPMSQSATTTNAQAA